MVTSDMIFVFKAALSCLLMVVTCRGLGDRCWFLPATPLPAPHSLFLGLSPILPQSVSLLSSSSSETLETDLPSSPSFVLPLSESEELSLLEE